MVDTSDLKSEGSKSRTGSSPVARTTHAYAFKQFVLEIEKNRTARICFSENDIHWHGEDYGKLKIHNDELVELRDFLNKILGAPK